MEEAKGGGGGVLVRADLCARAGYYAQGRCDNYNNSEERDATGPEVFFIVYGHKA